MGTKEMLSNFVVILLISVLFPIFLGLQGGGFILGLFVGVSCGYTIWLAKNSFGEYKKTQGRVAAILVPASTFEKYICEIVYIMVIMPVVCYSAFVLGTCIFGLIMGSWDVIANAWDLIMNSWHFGNSELVVAVLGWAVAFAFFFASLFFKKFSTAISVCTSLLLLIVVTFRMTFSIIGYQGILHPDEFWFVQRDFFLTFGNLMSNYFAGLMCVMLVFFVVMTYFRLKEERA